MSVQCYSCANNKGGICSITGGNPFTENPCRCYSPRYEIITHKQNNEPSYAELQAENEELKRELKQTEAQDQVVIDGLHKEKEKLKCLAMHLFWKYAERLMWKCDGMSQLSTKPCIKDYWLRKCIRWEDVRNKFYKAYRKVKKELKGIK